MSFLEQLKAQRGLGKKPPPKVVVEPIKEVVEKPISGSFPAKIALNHVMLADGVVIHASKLMDGTYTKCLHCGKVNQYPDTRCRGRFCGDRACDNLYPYEYGDDYVSSNWEEPEPTTASKPIEAEKTREQWLEEAVVQLDERLFKPAFHGVPKCRVSVGFPAGSRPRKVQKTLGQYWPPASASDGVPQIFISPSKMASGDPVPMLAVLVHEMVHAAVHPATGHGKEFRKLALEVGLQGPMRSTVASAKLKSKLKLLAKKLGPFPHGTIDPTTKPGKKGKLKGYECPKCGFKLYTTQKWVDLSDGRIYCPSSNDNMCTERLVFVPPKS